ncbi:MAG: FmdB family zinc ribbon protein [Nitrospirota bacterium]
MPIYEYECIQCGNRFEVIQKISDEPLSTCSKCSGELKKVLSQTGFVLKGSGWYVTDYPSEARKKAMESEKPKEDKPKEDKPKEETKSTLTEKSGPKEPAKVNK